MELAINGMDGWMLATAAGITQPSDECETMMMMTW
jgi:hypothetical protein